MSQNKKSSKIDWDKFAQLADTLVKFKAHSSFVPVRAESWEEVIYSVLDFMGYKVKWDPADHVKGVDLEVELPNADFLISAKGGKKDKTSNKINLSSYRLTRYENLDKKLDFLDKNAKHLDDYLICSREELEKGVKYRIFIMDSRAIVPEHFSDSRNWKSNKQGWYFGPDKNGLQAKIVKSMSHQLWYKIPLDFTELNKLTEVRIKDRDKGMMLKKVLKK